MPTSRLHILTFPPHSSYRLFVLDCGALPRVLFVTLRITAVDADRYRRPKGATAGSKTPAIRLTSAVGASGGVNACLQLCPPLPPVGILNHRPAAAATRPKRRWGKRKRRARGIGKSFTESLHYLQVSQIYRSPQVLLLLSIIPPPPPTFAGVF